MAKAYVSPCGPRTRVHNSRTTEYTAWAPPHTPRTPCPVPSIGERHMQPPSARHLAGIHARSSAGADGVFPRDVRSSRKDASKTRRGDVLPKPAGILQNRTTLRFSFLLLQVSLLQYYSVTHRNRHGTRRPHGEHIYLDSAPFSSVWCSTPTLNISAILRRSDHMWPVTPPFTFPCQKGKTRLLP